MIDLRPVYHEHQRETRAQLLRARAGIARKDGTTVHRVILPVSELLGEIDARYLSDRKIADLALRDAEFVMNMADAHALLRASAGQHLCVRYSAEDARMLGFDTDVIEGACRAIAASRDNLQLALEFRAVGEIGNIAILEIIDVIVTAAGVDQK